MHDAGCREDGVKESWGWVGGGQSAPAGSDGVGISAVQLATAEVLYRHSTGNREYHFDVSSILTILLLHTVVPSPFP